MRDSLCTTQEADEFSKSVFLLPDPSMAAIEMAEKLLGGQVHFIGEECDESVG